MGKSLSKVSAQVSSNRRASRRRFLKSAGAGAGITALSSVGAGPLIFVRDAKAADKDDYIVYDAQRGLLIHDKNGSGKGGEQVFAKLPKDTDLHNSDIQVKDPGDLLV